MKQSRRYKTTRHQKRNRRKRRWQLFRRITAITFLLFFLAILTVSALLYDDIHDLYVSAEEKIASINVGTFKNKTETKIYDKDGNLIKEVAPRDYYYISNDDIQPNIKKAVIAIEDIRFYEHRGYDPKAMARAAVDIIKNKGEITQGGSTITQQLVKLQFLSLGKTWERKIEEIFIAAKLEKMFTKDQILEFYLNNINYAPFYWTFFADCLLILSMRTVLLDIFCRLPPHFVHERRSIGHFLQIDHSFCP